MNWRHEHKYLIDEAASWRLYQTLSPILHRDTHDLAFARNPGSRGGYRVRSLYFDDYEERGLFDKLSGLDPRHKFRIRIYNNGDEVIHLEKKSKSGQMTHKEICALTREQTERLLLGDIEPIYCALSEAEPRSHQSSLLGQFYAEWQSRLLRPVLLVDYDRIPLLWPDGAVRITFDSHLSTGLFRQDLWDAAAGLQPVLEAQESVLEIKFDRFLPDFLRDLLRVPGASQLAISKYVLCRAANSCRSWEDAL